MQKLFMNCGNSDIIKRHLMKALKLSAKYPDELPMFFSVISRALTSHPQAVYDNIDEICQIFKEAPSSGGTNQLFQQFNSLEIGNLSQHKQKLFLESIREDATCAELCDYLMKKESTKQRNKSIVIGRLTTWLENLSKEDREKMKKFGDYLTGNGDALEELPSPEDAVARVFKNLNKEFIGAMADKFKNSDQKLSPGYTSIKKALSHYFGLIDSGLVIAADIISLSYEKWKSTRLEELYKHVTVNTQFFSMPEDKINSCRNTLLRIVNILETFCKECSDFRSKVEQFQPMGTLSRKFPLYSIEKLPEVDQFIRDFSELEVLCHEPDIIKIEDEEQSMEGTECQVRLMALKDALSVVRGKVDQLISEFEHLTIEEIRDELQIKRSEVMLGYLKAVLNSGSPQDKLKLEVVAWAINAQVLTDYGNIYMGLLNLKLPVNSSTEKLEDMELLQNCAETDQTMSDFSELQEVMKREGVSPEQAKSLVEKFRYLGQFKDQLDFLESIQFQFQRLREFTADSKNPEITFQSIDSLEILLLFFRELQKPNQEGQLIQSLADFQVHYDRVADNPLYTGLTDRLSQFTRNYNALVDFPSKFRPWKRAEADKCPVVHDSREIPIRFGKN